MPPKKRSRTFNVQPGRGRKYLMEHYAALPVDNVELKCGHVLHIFVNRCNCQRTDTERQIRGHFSSVSLGPSTNADIENVAYRFRKYHKLSDETEFQSFIAFCGEPFAMTVTETSLRGSPSSTPQDDCSVSVPIPSHSHQTPSPSVSATSEPMPSTSAQPLATPDEEQLSRPARTPLTPQKQKLKKQLKYVSAERGKEQERYRSTLKALKDQLKTPKRVENQAMKRSKLTISALKEKLKGHSLAVQLADRKSELGNLKAAHKRLKVFYKKRQNMPVSQYRLLQEKLKEKSKAIQQLENTNMILKEEIEELSAKDSTSVVNLKSDMKSYSSQTRMLVFDYITLNVPTASIPLVLEQSLLRLEKKPENIPNRTTVELMARELGSIADYQCAEKLIEHKHVTLGFDATMQEGCHVNEIHFTLEKDCVVAAVDELAGGTAADYSEHILGTCENLIDTYCYFNDLDEEDRARTKKTMIGNISVTNRQYSAYFKMDVTEKLKEETRLARSHNIDAEEIMGMFSASQKKAPHATVCFLSCRMRAKKNRTVKYLDGLSTEKKESLLRKAVTYGRKQRDRRRIKQKELRDEIVRRQEAKQQKKEDKERKDLEKKLKKGGLENVLKCPRHQ